MNFSLSNFCANEVGLISLKKEFVSWCCVLLLLKGATNVSTALLLILVLALLLLSVVLFVKELSRDRVFPEIELDVLIFQPQEWYCFSMVQLDNPRIPPIIIIYDLQDEMSG